MITPAQRSPFEVMLVFAFGLYAAIAVVAFDAVATTTLREFPQPWGRVFLGGIAVSCAVALYGVARAHTAAGVLVERAGLVGLGGLCLTYAIWSFGNTGWRALAFGVMLIALASASGWRWWQITRALRVARQAGP